MCKHEGASASAAASPLSATCQSGSPGTRGRAGRLPQLCHRWRCGLLQWQAHHGAQSRFDLERSWGKKRKGLCCYSAYPQQAWAWHEPLCNKPRQQCCDKPWMEALGCTCGWNGCSRQHKRPQRSGLSLWHCRTAAAARQVGGLGAACRPSSNQRALMHSSKGHGRLVA